MTSPHDETPWSDPRLSPHFPPRKPGEKPRTMTEAAADLDDALRPVRAELVRLSDWLAARFPRRLGTRVRDETAGHGRDA